MHSIGEGTLSELLARRGQPAERIALTVTLVFLVAGLTWVVLTDVLLYDAGLDSALVARIETAKGWVFVGLAAALLFVVTLRSARRQARVWNLTNAIVESIGDGVLLLDRERVIAHANPAAVRILNCPAETLQGMDAEEFSRRFRVSYPNGALVPPTHYVSQRVFDEAGPLRYRALLHPAGGKHEVVFDATAAAVRRQDGKKPRWVVSVMHDVTASERLERLRDEFFASAAHSLKTPVAIIKADAHALTGVAPERIAASLERQVDRIDRLVQNLLVLARTRSGTLQLHPVLLALEPLVEHVVLQGGRWHRPKVRAEIAEGPLLVHGDVERLTLVIGNLVSEACRLSPADARLAVLARREGDRVAVAVRYQPVAWREEASALYQRFDDVGIGRAVTRRIVEAHGGTHGEDVTESEVTLWFRLPAAIEAPT